MRRLIWLWALLLLLVSGCQPVRDLTGALTALLQASRAGRDVVPLVTPQGVEAPILVIGADGVTLAMLPGQATASAAALRSTPAPLATATPAQVWVVVIAATLNVRAGPGADYPSMGTAGRGERLAVIEASADGAWWRVRGAGVDGWVAARYVTREETAARQPTGVTEATVVVPTTPAGESEVTETPIIVTATPVEMPVRAASPPVAAIASAPVWVVVTAASLNVRAGPGVDYAAVGAVAQGERLVVIEAGADGAWLHVRGAEVDGWVAARYVTREETAAAQPTDASTTGTEEALVVTATPTGVMQPERAVPEEGARPNPDEGHAPPGMRVPSPSYGIAAHLLGDDALRQAALERVQALRFDWVKVQLRWLDYEGRAKGAYTWEWLDPIVAQVNARGPQLLISVVAAPEWARPAGDDLSIHGTPEHPEDLGDFLAALVGRYPGQVAAVEVWNEQNLGREVGSRIDPSYYVRMLAAAHRSIKAVDPHVIVVSGGLTPTGTDDGYTAMDDRRYLNAMLIAGAADYADAIGAHPSGYNLPPDADWRNPPAEQCGAFRFSCSHPHPSWSFKATLEDYHTILTDFGVDRQVWATEFGWAVCGVPQPGYEYCQDNTGWEQREWLRRSFELVREWGWDWVGVMVVWNLNYAGAAPGTEMAAFSLLDASGNPTDAFEGLQGLTH